MDPNVNTQVQSPSTPVQPPIVATQPDALAQPIVQAASTVTSDQPQMPGRAKETGPVTSSELAGFVEVVGSDSLEKEPLPPEVSSWMEKVSRDTSGEKPPEIVLADTSAPPAIDAIATQQVFVLPLGEEEFQKGLHQGVNNSVRWLAEWCKRLVKKLGDQTTYS